MKIRHFFILLLLTAVATVPGTADPVPADLQFSTAAALSLQGARSDTETAGFQPGGRFDVTVGALFVDAAALHFGLRGEIFSPSAFVGDRNLKGYASVGPQFFLFYRGKAAETETVTVMPGFQAGASFLLGKYEKIANRFFYPTLDTALFCDIRSASVPELTVRIFLPFSASFRRDVPVCLNSGIGVSLLFDHFLPSTAFRPEKSSSSRSSVSL